MLRLTLAAFHLFALGIGLGAVWARARALRGPLDPGSLRSAFKADTWWGIAAGLWIGTGLWRLLAGTERATGYYMSNHAFFGKMGLFLLVLALEVWPMITLIRWRRAGARGDIDTDALAPRARRIGAISYVEAVLVLLMVVAAVAMARGYGSAGG